MEINREEKKILIKMSKKFNAKSALPQAFF